MKTCDPQLYKQVREITQKGNSGIINPYFKEFKPDIIKNIEKRTCGSRNYRLPHEVPLLERCAYHASSHAKPLTKKDTVILVHPFYMHLSNWKGVVRKNNEEEAKTYLQKVLTLLQSQKVAKKVNRVVFETVHHYTSMTSFLVEQGFIDRVLFTQYDNGTLLFPQEVDRVKNTHLFFGGGYVKSCLKSGIDECVDRNIPHEQLHAISDICINSSGKIGDIEEMSVVGTKRGPIFYDNYHLFEEVLAEWTQENK